jgi:hypothetical protein
MDLQAAAKKAGDALLTQRQHLMAEHDKPIYKEFLLSSTLVEKLGLALIRHEEYVLLEDLLNCPELEDYLVR